MTSPIPIVRPRGLVQVADYPAGATFGPRRLTDFEFVWILRGSAQWTVRGGDGTGGRSADQRHWLRPGMLALAQRGTVDSYQWDPVRTSTHAYVHFTLGPAATGRAGSTWPTVRSLETAPILSGICDYLLDLSGQQADAARKRSDELVGLLWDLFISGPLGEPESTLTPYVAVMVERVRAIWSDGGPQVVPVEDLAAAANVSVGHAFRLFRQSYGCGPARAFELVRLARAAVALQRSNATLTEIAERAGFANPYHLSRRFSGTYGMPPGRFRTSPEQPDPYEPVRRAGLLPIAHALLHP